MRTWLFLCFAGTVSALTQNPDWNPSAFNFRVGTQSFGGVYQFTNKPILVETAPVIRSMGSNILKTSDTREGLDSVIPQFKYIFLWYQNDSYEKLYKDSAKRQEIFDSTFHFTQRLLANYNNSGKTFFLGNWEGDWMLLGSGGDSIGGTPVDAAPAKTNAMALWMQTRQDAIDSAKKTVPHANVEVYYYAELNLPRQAMIDGRARLVNKVLPFVHNLDYVSVSSYSIQKLSQVDYSATLDCIAANMHAKPGIPGKRVFIGEYGSAVGDSLQLEEDNRAIMLKALTWGCPYVLYWSLYSSKLTGPDSLPHHLWLINDKNAPTALYYTMQGLYLNGLEFLASFEKANNRPASQEEYQTWAISWLSPISATTVPNAPTRASATALGPGKARIQWQDNAGDEYGFRIERKGDTGAFTEINLASENKTGFTDTTCVAGVTYTYRVRSFNRVGMSSYSNETQIKLDVGAKIMRPRPIQNLDFSERKMQGTVQLTLKGWNLHGPIFLSVHSLGGQLLFSRRLDAWDVPIEIQGWSGPGLVTAVAEGVEHQKLLWAAP